MSEPIREILPEIEIEEKAAPVSVEKSPMHWHNFLVKIMLWLAAAYHLFQAAWISTGRIYHTPEAKQAVYAGIPALRFIDLALAAAAVAAAVLMIVARVRLRERMAVGIRHMQTAYMLLLVTQIGYGAARFILTGLPPLNLAVLGRSAGYLALLLINRSYYRRRAGEFSHPG